MKPARHKSVAIAKKPATNVTGEALTLAKPVLEIDAYTDWDLLQIPQGIRGHVFELMALIEFVKRYWTDNGGIGGVPMHVRIRCEGVPEEHFPALIELFTAFDDLVETHIKAHMLTGNGSDVSFVQRVLHS